MYRYEPPLRERFSSQVLREYEAARSKSVNLSRGERFAVESGHPAFAELAIGERRTVPMASLFLDLTNFTGRTFWDSQEEVADLAHAVLSGFTMVVTKLGGHVLGLRGDGLFAGFGPTNDSMSSVAAAAAAGGLSMLLVDEALNPALRQQGIAPVQARAGADFGDATFVRSGNESASEVNVIGFSSNFAAKCEKDANSWEMVVGERFATDIPDRALLSEREHSPKVYQRDGERRYYRYYEYKWRGAARLAEAAANELNGRALESVY